MRDSSVFARTGLNAALLLYGLLTSSPEVPTSCHCLAVLLWLSSTSGETKHLLTRCSDSTESRSSKTIQLPFGMETFLQSRQLSPNARLNAVRLPFGMETWKVLPQTTA